MDNDPQRYPKIAGDNATHRSPQPLMEGDTYQPEPLHPGQLVAGRYRIVKKLGQGGMGVVYRAEQMFLHKDCALKTLNKGLVSAIAWRRFQKEAHLATLLDHPGLVKVQDFGFVDETQEQPFFAMDLVEGETLQQLLRNGPLPLNAVLAVFHQLCLAIGHAHARDVIHRDIKPSNLIISGSVNDSESLAVKVLDFGIAKILSGDQSESIALTRTGEIFGTPLYMSPEQCLGQAIDDKSDMYSVGCVMYEALTGFPPFAGDTALATMMRHQTEKPLTLKEASLGRTFPAGLEEVVAKLLEKDPRARYVSLFDVADDLGRIKTGQGVRLGGSAQGAHNAANTVEKSHQRFVTIALTVALVACSAGAFVVGRLSAPPTQPAPMPQERPEGVKELYPEDISKFVEPKPTQNPAHTSDKYLPPNGQYFSAVVPNSTSRYFHFPQQSLGRISVEDSSSKIYAYDTNTGVFLPSRNPIAQGDVLISNFAPVELLADRTTIDNLSILKRFRVDDLRSLRFGHRTPPKGDPLKNIVNLKSLSMLDLEQVKNLDEHSIEELNQLPNLNALLLKDSSLGSKALVHFAGLKKLRAISISDHDATLLMEKLAGSPKLQMLWVTNCALGSKALRYIGSLQNLALLCLNGNENITDADLSYLRDLKNLRHIEVVSCPLISPQGLAQLRSLKEITIDRKQWKEKSPAGVDFLRKTFGVDAVKYANGWPYSLDSDAASAGKVLN